MAKRSNISPGVAEKESSGELQNSWAGGTRRPT